MGRAQAMLWIVVLLSFSYLAGSVPTGILVSRATRRIDIRAFGSGSMGAANTFRVLGWKAALVVVVVDVWKGWFSAAVIARWNTVGLGGLWGADPALPAILCGLAAVLGHTYPVFAGFRGGKGAATLMGVLLHLFPMAVPIGLAVFVGVLLVSGYVSLGSMTAVGLFPLITYLERGTLRSWLGVFSVFMAVFVIFTHRSNVARLATGKENRFEKLWLLRPRRQGS